MNKTSGKLLLFVSVFLISAWFIVSWVSSPEHVNRVSEQQNIPINFSPNILNKCQIKLNNVDWRINTMALFVSNMKVLTADNNWVDITFAKNNWQTPKTSLLWLRPKCQQQNPNERQQTIGAYSNAYNRQLVLNTSANMLYQAIKLKFTIGLPFDVNHANPLTQPTPLNNPEMFWSWQNGHKFMRLDLNIPQSNASWSLHLGSVGCSSKSTLRAPMDKCSYPNLVDIELSLPKDYVAGAVPSLVFDFSSLFHEVNIENALSCMFQANQQTLCQKLLDNLRSENIFAFKFTHKRDDDKTNLSVPLRAAPADF